MQKYPGISRHHPETRVPQDAQNIRVCAVTKVGTVLKQGNSLPLVQK